MTAHECLFRWSTRRCECGRDLDLIDETVVRFVAGDGPSWDEWHADLGGSRQGFLIADRRGSEQ